MASMPPPLPQIQGPPAPMQGQPGQIHNPAPGTLPYNPSGGLATQLVTGINSFVQNFKQSRQQEQDRNWELYLSGLQNKLAGIPVDDKKLAKYAKRSGRPLDLSSEDEKTIPPTQDQMMQASLASGASQVPGPSGQAIQQAAAQSPMPPSPQPQQPPQPGIMSRLGSMLTGQNPQQINPQGKFMNYLSQMGQMGQMNLEQMFGGAEQKKSTLNILKAAMQGDPKATELATRMGLFHTLGPSDELAMMMRNIGMSDQDVSKAMMFHMMGGQQMRDQIWKMAGEAAKEGRFPDEQTALKYYQGVFLPGGQPDSSIKPTMSFDALAKRGQLAWRLMRTNPNAPPDQVWATAEAAMGNGPASQETAMRGMQNLAKYPSAEQTNFAKWTAEMAQKQQFEKNRMGVEYSRLSQEKSIHEQNFALNAMSQVRKLAQDKFDNWYKLKNDKDATDEQKQAATTGLVDALKEQGVKGVSTERLDGFWGTITGGLAGKTGKLTVKMPEPDFKNPQNMADSWKKLAQWWTTPSADIGDEEDPDIGSYKQYMMQNLPAKFNPNSPYDPSGGM